MQAILVCDRFKWTLREYMETDSDFVDKTFQFMQIENEVRARQQKKAEQSIAAKGKGR